MCFWPRYLDISIAFTKLLHSYYLSNYHDITLLFFIINIITLLTLLLCLVDIKTLPTITLLVLKYYPHYLTNTII